MCYATNHMLMFCGTKLCRLEVEKSIICGIFFMMLYLALVKKQKKKKKKSDAITTVTKRTHRKLLIIINFGTKIVYIIIF